MFAQITTCLRPATRRLLAAAAAVTLAASSVLTPQPAAAATTYPVNVTFLKVAFPQTNDGWGDDFLEVYGTVAAYTSAGAASAGGLPYRNFGTWGQTPSGCPSSVSWEANGNFSQAPCPKSVVWPSISFHWLPSRSASRSHAICRSSRSTRYAP